MRIGTNHPDTPTPGEQQILKEIHKMAVDLSAEFAQMRKSIADETDAVTASSALITNLVSQLNSAISSATSLSDEDKVTFQNLVQQWNDQNAALAAAVAANTPAAPSNPPASS